MSAVITTAKSNITNQTTTRKFGDQINDNQSETVPEHQKRRGSYDAQMTSVQFQVNSSQMRREMQNPMQMQYQVNTGPLQFRSEGNFENSQMRNQWNPVQRQYQMNPDTMHFKNQNDFENHQVRNQMNSMQWQNQMNPNPIQFRNQDDSENPHVKTQMNSMLSQYQVNPGLMQFRNQDDSNNPQMNGQMNSRQWQYQMNPGPMQLQSQDNSENPRARYQMNSIQRQYHQRLQNAPTMHNLSEIIERDFRNQDRDQIEVKRSEEFTDFRSHMNSNYQREHHRQNTSLKRDQSNIYKVYLREENTKSNEREMTTMPSNSYPKPLFRAVTSPRTTRKTGTRSKKSTQWEEWIPPHLIEDEYYPDSFRTVPWGTGKTRSDDEKDHTNPNGEDITDADGNVITKSDGKVITDWEGNVITKSGRNVITDSDGKVITNSAQNVSWEGEFMDGYHPNEERFDFTATIPK